DLFGVAQVLAHSQEHLIDLVSRLYVTFLRRPADVAGLGGWVKALFLRQSTDEQVTDGFLTSAEYVNNHGGFVLHTSAGLYPCRQWIIGLYNDVLNRPPAESEIQAWLNAMQTTPQQVTPFFVASSFTSGPEKERQNIIDAYGTYLGCTPSESEIAAWLNAFQ